MNPIRKKRIEQKLKQMPQSYRAIYKKAVGGKSPASAVKSQCLECMGYQRTDIPGCTAIACPLWPYRPYQKKEK